MEPSDKRDKRRSFRTALSAVAEAMDEQHLSNAQAWEPLARMLGQGEQPPFVVCVLQGFHVRASVEIGIRHRSLQGVESHREVVEAFGHRRVREHTVAECRKWHLAEHGHLNYRGDLARFRAEHCEAENLL